MTNAQARNDYKASLETRDSYAQASAEGRYAMFRRRVEFLSEQYRVALLVGDPRADQFRTRGAAIINGFYSVEG